MARTANSTALLAAAFTALVLGAAAPVAEPLPIADFAPSKHGFNFTNSFSGSPIPGALGSLAPGVGPSRFGLCGGMSTAAADYYLAQRSPPTRPKPPLKGDWLFDYLQQRQVESLGGAYAMVPVFAGWMNAPDNGWLGVRHATATTIGAIAVTLGESKPVVLGLVRVAGGKGQPIWENHQVLATRADKSDEGVLALHIYDPNYPKHDDVLITCTPAIIGAIDLPGLIPTRVPVLGYTCQQTVGGRKVSNIRGLFTMPFASKNPPAGQ
ncbi:MAG: hypothetical protein ACREJO_03015 [Phycisphaerales bacterium]